MTVKLLIFFYSIAIIFASLIGGWLAAIVKLQHTQTQMLMSYVSGLMLGIAFYHLLPHAIHALGSDDAVDHAVWWLMVGMLVMFVLLRLFHFHQHDPEVLDQSLDHSHCHGNEYEETHKLVSSLSWVGISVGMALHTLSDGVALGAAVQAGSMKHAPVFLSGFGVFAAIVLHKPLDAMSVTSLMQAGGWSLRSQFLANVIFAFICPIGAYLFILGAGQFGDTKNLLVGSALSFSAGVFICIALSDLLPEIQFHSHDKLNLTVALFAGVLTAYGIGLLEGGSH
jgi:zinc and cadmium transporter|tara:strand:- start:653 stop:1498 length:846 start_codon:yes stop_codon:yes gene_type:complete